MVRRTEDSFSGKDEEYIINKSEGSGQTTIEYASEPIRGVKDEIRHVENTGRIEETLLFREIENESPVFKLISREHEPSDIPLDEKMSGGYPYDALIHVDKDEAIMPGLTGQSAFAAVAPHGRRTIWSEVSTQQGSDNSEVTIGSLDGKYYVLDPTTHEAITPAFTYMQSLTNESMAVHCPNYRGADYVIRARETVATVAQGGHVKWEGKRKYPKTPDFLCAPMLSMTRKQPTDVVVVNERHDDIATIDAANPFGIEKPNVSAAARGNEVMRQLIVNVAEYAQINKNFREKFTNPGERLELPYVETPTIGASLQMTTSAELTTLYVSANNSVTFQLAQRDGGDVVFVNQRGEVLRPTDEAYKQLMEHTDVMLREYFTRLYQESTKMSAERITQLRHKLGRGGLSGWRAAREVRKRMR